MVPFLVEMCIFAFPTTFATSVLSVSTLKMHFPFFRCPEGSKQVLFWWRGHQGQCANHHHSNFHGWGTYQGCQIQEVRNYLGLLPYNELFLA
jgi:hypothetical protein